MAEGLAPGRAASSFAQAHNRVPGRDPKTVSTLACPQVSGELRGMTLVFDRTPQGDPWPADDSGTQRQSFQLNLVPSCGGCSMIARGAWSGYGQGAASGSGDNLSASAERIR